MKKNILIIASKSYFNYAKSLISSIEKTSENFKIFFYGIAFEKEEAVRAEKCMKKFFSVRDDISCEISFIEKELSSEKKHSIGRIKFSELMAYSANVRWEIVYDLLKNKKVKNLLYLDADSLVYKDIQALYDYVGSKNIAFKLRMHKGANKAAMSGVAYFDGRKESVLFARKLKQNLEKCGLYNWFSDQKSLGKTYKESLGNQNIKFIELENLFIDWKFKRRSVIWVGKGKHKERSVYIKMQNFHLNRFMEMANET